MPSGDFFVGLAAHIGVTYVSISIGLNVLVSCMICARIVYLGLAVHRTASQQETLRYTGTIPIIVETALLYAISGIAFAVSYGIGSEISIFFLSIYAMCTVSSLVGDFYWISTVAWTVHIASIDHHAHCGWQGMEAIQTSNNFGH